MRRALSCPIEARYRVPSLKVRCFPARLPALGRQCLTTPGVGLLCVQHIARGAGGQHVARARLAERPPEPREVGVEAL